MGNMEGLFVMGKRSQKRTPHPPREGRLSIDLEVIRSVVNQDYELLENLVDGFRQSSRVLVEQMQEALHNQEAEILARAAHTLKGAAAYFGAHLITDRAMELEALAIDQNFEKAHKLFAEMKSAVSRALEELNHLLEQKHL
ncbi:MAG: Hpt domain-containing protein [Calditrichaeota bacterium]|nr:MAG: Hpt domain-containing protein [Calditrichota bacterium]